jgi:sugar/nucleoside kinase (ribokinase family)
MKNKLLVLGTIAYDGIETLHGKRDKILGGCATYIGLSASQFKNNCALISVIGSDFENSDTNILLKKGLDLSGVEKISNSKTFFWSGIYDKDLNSRTTITTELNVLEKFKPIVPENFKKPKILLLGNLDPNIQLDVLNQMEAKPSLVILDTMNFWIERFKNELDKLIKKVDIISINDEEARQITNEFSLVKAAKKIQNAGPKYVIIKKGEHGAMLFHNDKNFSIPGIPLEEVYDPTGAGDSFVGAIAGYLTEVGTISFDEVKKAMAYGTAIASFTVEKFGPERLIELTNHELKDRIDLLKKITNFNLNT